MPDQTTHSLRNFILGLIVLSLSLATAYYLNSNPPNAQREKPPVAVLQVEHLIAEPQNYAIEVESYGIVQARTRGNLTARVSGEIINVSDNFRSGSFFEKDDLLLQIDPRDFQTALVNAKANVSKAQATLAQEQAQADQAAKDWQRLGNSGKAPDLVLRKPQLSAARAELEWNNAALAKAHLGLSRTQITAPYNGRIISKHVDLGQYVTTGTNLAEIFAIDYAEVRLPLSSNDYAQLEIIESYQAENKAGSDEKKPQVKIVSQLGNQKQIYNGFISRSEGVFDSSTRQIRVVAHIDDPYGMSQPLIIGQFVTAIIKGREIRNVFVIPNRAIYQGSYVFVVEDGVIKRRDIKLDWQDSEMSVISEGLVSGDIVVTTPLNDSISGTKVRLKQP